MTSAPPADPALQLPPAPEPFVAAGPPAVSEPPEPPQGPGVYPPFPAPPVEGKGLRIGMGLGIGAGVALLVCGGGIAAVIGVAVSGTSALNERADAAVNPYFKALEAKKFDEAYGLQCASEKQRLTQAEFVSSEQAAEPIQKHQVGTLDLASIDLSVPVTVTYTDGQTGTLQVYLDQSQDTGEFQVCGVQE
jgi:hypothetical protein